MSTLKWENVASLANWVEPIYEFEISQGHMIIGTKIIDGTYAMKFRNGTVELLPFDDVKLRWPHLLESFYMDRLKLTMENHVPKSDGIEMETANLVFLDGNSTNPPTRIIGKATIFFSLFFICNTDSFFQAAPTSAEPMFGSNSKTTLEK